LLPALAGYLRLLKMWTRGPWARAWFNSLGESGKMARRPNYGAEKRSKELEKNKKAEEKAAKKAARKEAAALGEGSGEDGEQELWPGLPVAPEPDDEPRGE
jgi:hypothetical protein